ncbi:MAG: DUF1501 domain-containing protein [Pirellulaceae bacterium]
MACSRRKFLKSMVGTASFLSLSPTIPAFLRQAAAAAQQAGSDQETVLVVLQLSGGNDGLNTVVPYADDAYGRARDTLRLTPSQVIPIDSYLGFHPELKDFHRLLEDHTLTVVQGVGYPKSDRDHDVAMREWHTGRPGEPLYPTGWIGRTVDQIDPSDGSRVPAAFVGPIAPPFAMNAAASVIPTVRSVAQLTYESTRDRPAERTWVRPNLPPDGTQTDNPLVNVLSTASRAADTMSQRVEQVLASAVPAFPYPSLTLAQQLQMVAQLIRADLGIRIYFVELGGGGIGGFDNHANQRDNHAALLREMSLSVGAFMDDLKREHLMSRVLLMTFSEFGRTLSENGRRGTDHGAAAPVFLFGGRVKGGIYGKYPSLTDLDQDALKFQIDYRAVYATVLQSWLGLEAAPVLGAAYEPIDVIA